MKKSILSIALGLVLFLGACSVAEGKFLDKVKGKTVYEAATMLPADEIGTFSADGKTFGEVYTFVEASDADTATYSYTYGGMSVTYTIKTADGKSGSMSAGGESPPVWFK